MNRLGRLLSLAVLAIGGLTQVGCGSSSSSTPATPPGAPTGLTATSAAGAVGLTWTASSGATSYSVYRGIATGALASKTKLTGSPTSPAFTDTTVTNDVPYFYQVTASNSAGESAASTEATATPSAAAAPAAPTGVTATAAATQVTLTWTAVPNATSYNVYWSTTPGVTKATGTKVTGVTSGYMHTSLTNGTTYYYVVTAVGGTMSLESLDSLQVSATPNLPPPYIQATVVRWPSVVPNVPVMEVRICTTATCMADVTNATVKVDATTLAWDGARGGYEATSPMPSPGATVTVSVTIPAGGAVKAGTYTATGTMYTAAPSVTSPTFAQAWTRSAPNTMTWSGGAPTTTSPASAYVVGIMDATTGAFYPPASNGGPFEEPIGTTSYTLPANLLPAGNNYVAWVGIATNGIVAMTGGDGIPFSGALGSSGLYLGYVSSFVPFTAN
jgi:fibronectin type 3 domain-containing protein